MSEIELFLTLKLSTYVKWIIWNGTVYIPKNGFGIINLQLLMRHNHKLTQTKRLCIIRTFR